MSEKMFKNLEKANTVERQEIQFFGLGFTGNFTGNVFYYKLFTFNDEVYYLFYKDEVFRNNLQNLPFKLKAQYFATKLKTFKQKLQQLDDWLEGK